MLFSSLPLTCCGDSRDRLQRKMAVHKGYDSPSDEEELAAQPGASGKNIWMAAARSSARCYRMLDAAGCSPPLGSAAERHASVSADSARSSDDCFVVRTRFQRPAHQQRRNLPRKQTDCSLAYPPDGIANTRDEPQQRAIGRGPDQRPRPVRSRPRNRSFRGRAREIGLMRKGVARVRLTSLDAPPPTIRSEPSS